MFRPTPTLPDTTITSGTAVSVGTLNLFDKSETSNDGSTSTFGTVNVYAGGSIVNKTSGRMNMGTLNQRGGEVTINSANRINPQTYNITGGRVVIGPWYCQPDEFLVSGENQNFTWILLSALGIIFLAGGIYVLVKR